MARFFNMPILQGARNNNGDYNRILLLLSHGLDSVLHGRHTCVAAEIAAEVGRVGEMELTDELGDGLVRVY